MSDTSFDLVPFPGSPPSVSLRIEGSLHRHGNSTQFFITIVCANIDRIRFPAHGKSSERKYGLWEQTCFEFFLAPKNSRRYWEFNISPSGAWNVYRFKNYREGMIEESAVLTLHSKVIRQRESLSISLDFDSRNLFGPELIMRAGVSAVIEDIKGMKSYWALAHMGEKPDFHARKSFTIEY